MRVLAAMSGGVDSAVAAARAVDAGHDVTGVHLALSAQPAVVPAPARAAAARSRTPATRAGPPTCSASRSTCGTSPSGSPRTWSTTSSPSTPPAARPTRACAATRRSSSPRCSTGPSRSASTPSCTGHYARLVDGRTGASCTARSTRPRTSRTCSAVLTREPARPARCSRSATRPRTRSAPRPRARGLAVADKPDSHDICFIADGDTAGFLRAPAGRSAPGDIVDADRRGARQHDGAYAFTVGQRKGLRLGTPAPDGRPRYVLDDLAGDQHGDGRPARGARRRPRLDGVRARLGRRRPAGRSRAGAAARARRALVPATVRASTATRLGSRCARAARRGVAAGQAVVLLRRPDPASSARPPSTAPPA